MSQIIQLHKKIFFYNEEGKLLTVAHMKPNQQLYRYDSNTGLITIAHPKEVHGEARITVILGFLYATAINYKVAELKFTKLLERMISKAQVNINKEIEESNTIKKRDQDPKNKN